MVLPYNEFQILTKSSAYCSVHGRSARSEVHGLRLLSNGIRNGSAWRTDTTQLLFGDVRKQHGRGLVCGAWLAEKV